MTSFMRSILLGLFVVALVTVTPSLGQARAWGGGWRAAFYPRWWGSPYWYSRWGWGAYFPYPAYYYSYPAYSYPSNLDPSWPDGVSAVPVPAGTGSMYSAYFGSTARSPEEAMVSTALTASGVVNDNGRLRWPLGLQIVGGPNSGRQADELREQIDALFQEAIEQRNRGSADRKLLEEITRAVDRFRNLLTRDRRERAGLPKALYDEGARFLTQLDDAAMLQPGLKSQGAAPR